MFGSPGPMELLVIGMIALLLFGKRLPEVARSLGKGIVEFKKGVSGIEDEVRSATNQASNYRPQPKSDSQSVTSPKFEPPTSEPVSASDSVDSEKTV
ncbi:MAG: twin-arginine translocase TatA/TatE family subunit [Planctomycetaceae bacterium]|nr:twin-arginine translocase TatA/TatE family subunit [Planctomycetaceae bacterium]